ncbi:phenylacetate--CoA ligase family protein [Halonatronum saccharophilum]|uniref:phenylacetate--CoA ligase family protein n=1 Tax=Halonatronum saccharophilum TaxID=150060 RepID=UPI000483AC54|nr:phenylacetate--CoA ligase family protein [Halonatronum saccharophilum]
MNNLLKNVYENSPIFLQNIMTSIYGYVLSKRRFPKNQSELLQQLKELEFISKRELEKFKLKELQKIIIYSYNKVPYYKKLFKDINFNPNNIEDFNDIRRIPFLTKEKINLQPNQLISKEFDQDKLVIHKTSGSTGSPLAIYKDGECNNRSFAYWERLRRNHGVKIGDKKATFFGRAIVSKKQSKPPFWRYNLTQNQLLFSIFHLTQDNLPAYINKLEEFAPLYIESYPSALFVIAKYLEENKININLNLKCIFTTAENLEADKRELIEEQFKTKIVDQYGSSEAVVFAGECKYGNMHIFPGFGFVEVIDEEGNPTDGLGEIVVTGFLNKAMPFIRYKLGDMVELDKDFKCKCGRSSAVIVNLGGRKDDLIITPDGNQVSRLGYVLKNNSEVKEAQIIQNDIREIIIKVVPNKGVLEINKDKIITSIKKRLGEEINYSIVEAQEIPRQENGKFRYVVCNLSDKQKEEILRS